MVWWVIPPHPLSLFFIRFKMEENKFVDFAKDDIKYNYEKSFRHIFGNIVQKDLLRWCIYSITLNDPAHQLDHVLKVSQEGMEIFNHYRDIYGFNDLDESIVAHACLMHDLGCRYNRDDHHVIGYGLVYSLINSYCPGDYSPDVLKKIAVCVLEHRSSNKKKPSSVLSEIVSVADSGEPHLSIYLNRALKFRLSGREKEYGKIDDLFESALNHIDEKFGPEGYHWNSYPDIGLSYYTDEWEEFKEKIKDRQGNLNYLKDKSNDYKNEKWNIYKDLL